MAAGFRVVWTLGAHGWATCAVAHGAHGTELAASYVGPGPEELLTAVVRLLAGEDGTSARFEAEPGTHLWTFRRIRAAAGGPADDPVLVRLLPPDGGSPADRESPEYGAPGHGSAEYGDGGDPDGAGPDGGDPDHAGPDGGARSTAAWSTVVEADTLARALVRCFDDVARAHGEDGYRALWGAPFPRTALESLRRARHEHRARRERR
ncbi:hypothetical protein [Streptomyces sp. NPDC050560]|uniref:hypothetical protein n=1 Tax=Streptomyces sp. NPDC050560 TaxID=3365630 RepID=UPI00379FA980